MVSARPANSEKNRREVRRGRRNCISKFCTQMKHGDRETAATRRVSVENLLICVMVDGRGGVEGMVESLIGLLDVELCKKGQGLGLGGPEET